jgi:hypothetical protein
MENKKVSKKALRSLLKDSIQQSITHLELPKPNKRVKKIINRTSRKMAAQFSHLLKKEYKRSKSKKGKQDSPEARVA